MKNNNFEQEGGAFVAEKRKDSKGRILRDGENVMPDGRYRYQYTDSTGKRKAVYSWKLVPTDRTPEGKGRICR